MAGCYIHIPFCSQKCSYCDFHFSTSQLALPKMVDALQKELELRAKYWKDETIETLYFGGGTPSILSFDKLEQLLVKVKQHYNVSDKLEITLECNPENCTIQTLEKWKALGVNRLSIGVQSFDDEQLKWMNRSHVAADSIRAIQDAKSVGFDELSVDLIYGLPQMSLEDWEKQLKILIELNPEHISAYCLTVESKTLLAKWVSEWKIQVAESEMQAAQFDLLVSTLKQAHYEQYEISNFCRDQHYSKHNTSYWKGLKYIGIGPSAHGYDGVNRYWNVANNSQYIRSIEAGGLPETIEKLSALDCFNEMILIGLRTKWGVSKQALSQYHQVSESWKKQLEEFKNEGLLEEFNEAYILTEKGRLLADGIASDLFVLE